MSSLLNGYAEKLYVTSMQATDENSLQNVLERAQSSDIICFNIQNSTSSIINLSSVLTINKNLTINGINVANQDTLTLLQSNKEEGVIQIGNNANVSLLNLKITNGKFGIYINVNGKLELNYCQVFNNRSYDGGGIIALGNSLLKLNYCEVFNNSSSDYGGIYSEGIVSIRNSIISNNSSSFNSGGITIENGLLSIEDSKITNNIKGIQLIYSTMVMKRCLVDGNWHTGNAWGGGIKGYAGTNINIEDSQITNNLAGDGGGINSVDRLTIRNSIISNNRSTTDGGGIYFSGTRLIIDRCIIENNTAYNSAGGIYLYTGNNITISNSNISNNRTTNSWDSYGGGIYVMLSPMLLENSTIAHNQSVNGGGICIANGNHEIKLINNTIFNNIAQKDGGAVRLSHYLQLNGKNNIVNTTLINNTIVANNAQGNGDGIYFYSMETGKNGYFNLYNNIIALNGQSTNSYDIYNGNSSIEENEKVFIESAANITKKYGFDNCIGNLNSIDYNSVSSIFHQEIPQLQNNGGFTKTVALAENSIAIASGVFNIVGVQIPIVDQRGILRNAPPCIGAYEYDGTTNINKILSETYSNVYSVNSSIVVTNIPIYSQITIFDSNGRLFFKRHTQEYQLNIPVKKGFYIVKINDDCYKVIVS